MKRLLFILLIFAISCKQKNNADYYYSLFKKYNDSAFNLRLEVPNKYLTVIITSAGNTCLARHVFDSLYGVIHKLDGIQQTYWQVYLKEKYK